MVKAARTQRDRARDAVPMLVKGASGPMVRELTRLLVEHGHFDRITATFDHSVKRAVEGFQARHLASNGRPLVVDGKVGELTWWALRTTNNPALLEPPDRPAVVPAGGSRLGRAALRVALDEMAAGSREIRSNNRGQFVRKYLNGMAEEGNSWCAGFVSWCFSQTPGGVPYRYSVGARDIRNQFKAKDWAFDAGQQDPEPGDIVVWWRGQPNGWQGHIGFVLKLEHGILYTVEGNKGNYPAPVKTFNYVLSRMDKLLGFGRAP